MTKTAPKLPPNAIELEIAILGSLIIDSKCHDEIFSLIKRKEVFYKTEHQYIFSAIHQLFKSGHPIDLLTIANELRKNGDLDLIGGDYALVQITQKVSSSAHVDYHARVLIEKYVKRELIALSQNIAQNGYDEQVDVFNLLDQTQDELDRVNETFGHLSVISDSKSDMPEAINELKEHVKRISETDTIISGVPTGIKSLDEITNGWQSSDLFIIAARPGMGKTSLAMAHVHAAASAGVPVALFSLEMNRKQLTARYVATQSNLHVNQILREGFTKDQYWKSFYDVAAKSEHLPIKLVVPHALSIFDLRMQAKMLKRKQNIGLIIVDYLQLMTSGKNYKDANMEVQEISRGLKSIAKELDVPVIALSQLSREVEKTSSKRPKLVHLRDSGSIEQDADGVIFIHRPEYYGLQTEHPLIPFGCNTEIIVAKHRNGAVGTVGAYFDSNKTKFMDSEPSSNNSSF